jgi:hypothetical protein
VIEVAEPVVEEGIAQAVVVCAGKPLRIRHPVLRVALGPDAGELVVMLPGQVGEGLLVEAGVEEPFVVFLDEVSVRRLADFELESELVEEVIIVLEEETLIVAEGDPFSIGLEGGFAGSLEAGFASPRRAVGHDRRASAEHVDP